ncbi:MAG: hypothetical protein IJY20_05035 [Clostridia bacterium]|nr:hypothetical protein [Clostridia bacterium]
MNYSLCDFIIALLLSFVNRFDEIFSKIRKTNAHFGVLTDEFIFFETKKEKNNTAAHLTLSGARLRQQTGYARSSCSESRAVGVTLSCNLHRRWQQMWQVREKIAVLP